MTTKEQVGYYDAAVKVKVILVSLVTSLGTVLLPRASYYVEMEMKGEFRRISAKALNFVMLVALPLMIFFMLFAEQSIRFLTGGTLYESATLPMQIIMPTLLFIGITNVLGIQILVPLGREKTVLVSEIVGAVTDLILNVILIPLYGAAGAAIGTLAAEFAVLVVQYIALRSEVRGAFLDIHYFTHSGCAQRSLGQSSANRHILVAGVCSDIVFWPLRHRLTVAQRTARKRDCVRTALKTQKKE